MFSLLRCTIFVWIAVPSLLAGSRLHSSSVHLESVKCVARTSLQGLLRGARRATGGSRKWRACVWGQGPQVYKKYFLMLLKIHMNVVFIK